VIAPTARKLAQLHLNTPEGRRYLAELIRECGAELVILDTLYRFLPGVDPSDNGEMGEVCGQLNDLAQETGAGFLVLDHVRKGEGGGPVSHSALGAVVKGGAARTTVALQRVAKDQGGKWSLDVESHFGSWEMPLYYQRPKRGDGWGYGCIGCTATQAHGLSRESVCALFEQYGELKNGKRAFPSTRKLRLAVIAAGLATGNDSADKRIKAILDELTTPHANRVCAARPILVESGQHDRSPVVFTWQHGGSEDAESDA
jgi:hypothetical protein